MNELLERAKEKLKAIVLQYVLICKLIIKYRELIDSPSKTIEEQIKCEKLHRALESAIKEALKGFEEYFDVERQENVPINLGFRISYKKLKENKDRII